MYRVTAWFKNHKVSQEFHDVHDAIEYRDHVDAHYPTKVIFRNVDMGLTSSESFAIIAV